MAGTEATWPIMLGNQRVLEMSLVVRTNSRNARFVGKRYDCLKPQGVISIHNLCEKQDVWSLYWISVCC
jgi:hypothetical protein